MRSFAEIDLLDLLPHMRRYALGLTSDGDRAEDLVQDALERALKNAHRFQAGTNLKAWLFTIIHNTFLSDMRRAKVRGNHLDADEVYSPNLSIQANQEANVGTKDIKGCLGQLKQHEREVLLLVAIEGMTYEQAAEVMDVELGTVKSRLFRARERFRALYTDMTAPQAANSAYTAEVLQAA